MTAVLAEPRLAYEPPPNTEHEGDWRWYVHPLPPHERFISVTTALSSVGKDALVFWATGLSAKAAFADLPKLVAATIRQLCGRTYNRCQHDWRERCTNCPCGECRNCVVKWIANQHFAEKSRRADEGRRVHKRIDWWVLNGGQWPTSIDEELKPYIRSFEQFVSEYGLTHDNWEMTEATVLNREYMWGGTLDGQLRIRSGVTELADDFCARLGQPGSGVLVTTDTKTREKEEVGIWPDYSEQLAAYRRGETIMLSDGTEHPLPTTDGGAVLQLRPDGYTFRPVVTDENTYAAFLNALGHFRWQVELGNKSTQVSAFPLPEEYKRQKANRKARERRAAKKQAAAQPPAEGRVESTAPPLAPAPPAKSDAGSAAAGLSCTNCYQPLPAGIKPGDRCPVCGRTTPRPAKKVAAKKAAARKTTAKPAGPALTTGQRLGLEPRTPVAAQVQDPFDVIDQLQDPPF